jgi:hypothetical protein
MKKTMWLGCFFIILTTVCYGGKYGTAVTRGGQAKITFQVLDDEQRPVEKARVQTGFYYDPKKQGIITGETDTNGLCAIEGITHMDMWYSMEKSGYYETEGRYVFGQLEPPVINNRWQPWNPTNTVVLKRIKNPVSMYVRQVNLGVPEYQKPLGFDLEKGDWVAPYGKGVCSDIIFYAECDNIGDDSNYNYNLTVTFPNEKDGIQTFTSPEGYSSQLKSAQQAPATGYNPKWVQIRRRTTDKIIEWNYDTNRKYYFRVRTVLDKDGNIVSALYGKIYGDFLYFTYYLNPTSNDRNIEFDPAKNLFGGRDRFAP